MSIKPEFVKKIFSGDKKFEYRKSIFKNPKVNTIVIYVTKPCGNVVGEFSINKILCDIPQKIWKDTRTFSGVDEEFFNAYCNNREKVYAIEIGDVVQYKHPLSLQEFDKNIKTPPQSFRYLQ